MDASNFTIEGHLGLPGFTRVPPPFGTPREAVQAIHATLARVQHDEMLAAANAQRQLRRTQSRQRLTVATIGVACTVTAALIGAYTGQRRQPLAHFDQMPLPTIAQAPAPSAPQAVTPPRAVAAETALPMASPETASDMPPIPTEGEATPATTAQRAVMVAETPAIAPAETAAVKSQVKAARPRTLARAVGRSAAPASSRSASSAYEPREVIETYRALSETRPIASSYVEPGTSARIELQRHTRLTD